MVRIQADLCRNHAFGQERHILVPVKRLQGWDMSQRGSGSELHWFIEAAPATKDLDRTRSLESGEFPCVRLLHGEAHRIGGGERCTVPDTPHARNSERPKLHRAWAATGESAASPQAGIPPEGSDMLGELSAGEDTESCAEADGEQRRLMGSGIHTNPGGKGLELVPCASDAGWCLGCTGGTCCGIGGRTPVCDIGLYVNRAVYPAR